MHELGVRIRALRKQKGWTQKQLAAQIHRSAAADGSYEQDTQTPPIDVLVSLSSLFHMTIEELLGLEKNVLYLSSCIDEDQIRVLDKLLDEFSTPTGNGKELSIAQMQIINELIRIFLANCADT